MNVHRLVPSTTLALAVGALVVGLAVPAAAHEAKHLLNGADIKKHSIAGNRLKANTVTGAQIKESTLGVVPRAKSLPALVWHPLTLKNDWSTYGNGRAAAYAVDAQGLVHLRGEIMRLDATKPVAFTLPVALRPTTSASLELPILIGSGLNVGGRLGISSSGDVYPDVFADGSNADTELVSLEGVTYSP